MLEWGDNLFHDQRRRCVVSVDILAMSEAEIRARGVVWVVGELERLARLKQEKMVEAGIAPPVDPRAWED